MYPNMMGIMKAKNKELKVLSLNDLGFAEAPARKSGEAVHSLPGPESRNKIQGERRIPSANWLRLGEEAKVIRKEERNMAKGIWIFIEHHDGLIRKVSLNFETGKDHARSIRDPVTAVVLGKNISSVAETAKAYGADKVIIVDDNLGIIPPEHTPRY